MKKETVGSASASLVLGILGMFLFIPAIPAIICGHVARSKIKRAPDIYSGKGMALAGLILGYLAVCLTAVIAVASALVVSGTSRASEEARIAATRHSIANIETAVRMYEVTYRNCPDSLDQLTRATDSHPAMMSGILKDPWGTQYRYSKTVGGYEIRSAGPDRMCETPDDITN